MNMFDNSTDAGRMMNKIVAVLGVILVLFVGVQTIKSLKSLGYSGAGEGMKNIITVSGKGEKIAVPDVASVTFAVVEQAATVSEAQTKATAKMNSTLEALKNLGIEDNDIKTADYNVYPRYEYFNQVCTQFSCPPEGRQRIVGYEVRQSVMVKIRKVEDAGKILAAIGSAGVSDISGLNFTVDNEDALIREARKLAIEDARTQAEELARDLGVKIVGIVSFNETGGYPVPYYRMDAAMGSGYGGAMMESAVPPLPTGENKITSNVSITYEIR